MKLNGRRKLYSFEARTSRGKYRTMTMIRKQIEFRVAVIEKKKAA